MKTIGSTSLERTELQLSDCCIREGQESILTRRRHQDIGPKRGIIPMQPYLTRSRVDFLYNPGKEIRREEAVEVLKGFIVKHLDKILMAIILLAAIAGTYYLEDRKVILYFYYLPVLFSGYFFGRRLGVLTAVTSILVVLLGVWVVPGKFHDHRNSQITLQLGTELLSWGGFLILVAAAVGTLYERSEQRLQDLKDAYIGILEILSKYLESTDRYTKGHSIRVSELAMDIAVAMELSRTAVENIRVAGLLHDIGKIEISGEILRKAAQLSRDEKELVDLHTTKGAYLLSAVGAVLKEVVPIVIAHHRYFIETLDTSSGGRETIPLGARIVAVADAFDAMTTDRPYRKGITPWKAMEEIENEMGTQFDPKVVEAFKRVISGKMEMM
jgi:putative nucleotidyltransferase with HDIG domain